MNGSAAKIVTATNAKDKIAVFSHTLRDGWLRFLTRKKMMTKITP